MSYTNIKLFHRYGVKCKGVKSANARVESVTMGNDRFTLSLTGDLSENAINYLKDKLGLCLVDVSMMTEHSEKLS